MKQICVKNYTIIAWSFWAIRNTRQWILDQDKPIFFPVDEYVNYKKVAFFSPLQFAKSWIAYQNKRKHTLKINAFLLFQSRFAWCSHGILNVRSSLSIHSTPGHVWFSSCSFNHSLSVSRWRFCRICQHQFMNRNFMKGFVFGWAHKLSDLVFNWDRLCTQL